MGGSHGGFLTGNLVGQYPSRFKCAVLRNPVMDISLMIHVSDIPDWTYVEAFGSQVSHIVKLHVLGALVALQASLLEVHVRHCHD